MSALEERVLALPDECDACKAKPGAPTLCTLCLAVRALKGEASKKSALCGARYVMRCKKPDGHSGPCRFIGPRRFQRGGSSEAGQQENRHFAELVAKPFGLCFTCPLPHGRTASVAAYIKGVPMSYAQHFSERGKTPQGEQADSRQVKNSAGGFVFQIDRWKRLERFLILGAEGGTFYAGERKLVMENAKALRECLDEDPERAVNLIVEISDSGRAPKNDEALFCLAVASGHPKASDYALRALPKVARTASYLFDFVAAARKFRGWGPKFRKAIAAWYNDRSTEDLIRQVTKYQQRNGVSNRGLLRQSHLRPKAEHQPVYRWIVDPGNLGSREVKRKSKGTVTTCAPVGVLPELLAATDRCLHTTDPAEAIRLIHQYRLPHEVVPKSLQGREDVKLALLEHMPVHAMLRNLGAYTAAGVIGSMNRGMEIVKKKLTDEKHLRQKRVHPLQILLAMGVYKVGHGEKGKTVWQPVRQVLDVLDEAFYLSFGAVEPSGKRTLLALDISGSMASSMIAKTMLSAREASAAMAMVTARTEKDNWHAVGFTCGVKGEYRHPKCRGPHASGGYYNKDQYISSLSPLDISPRQRLDDIVASVSKLPLGGTDCSLPMMYALDKGLAFDTFIVYTDNETWAGELHPHQALELYRQRTGINAKLIVVGMTATEFSIANPSDPGMLDVVGFDTNAPAVMADFAKG